MSTNGDGDSASGGAREKLTFDIWQRLVRVEKLKDKGTHSWDSVDYAYNGLNWRVLEKREVAAVAPIVPPPDGAPPFGSKVRYQFYSPQWQQLLEVEAVPPEPSNAPVPTRVEQQFWGLRGVDDALLRRIDTDGDGSFISTVDKGYYQLTDSSFSVIAHIDANSGRVRQRMSYDGYGNLKVLLTANFDGDGQVTHDDLLRSRGSQATRITAAAPPATAPLPAPA